MAGAGGFDREKAIELAVNTIQKQFGKGAIMRLGDGTSPQDDIDVISTGSIGLDVALGTGGLPVGESLRFMGRSLVVRQL